MKRFRISVFAAVIFSAIIIANSFGEGQKVLTVQGRLTDAGGTPLDGFFDITYRIHDDSTGGNLLWSESHIDVPVNDGLFSVELGKVSSFFDIFTDDRLYWLETQVEADPPLSPRRVMGGAPHAFNAEALTAGRAIGGSLDTAQAKLEVTDVGSSLRLRVVPTAQTTGRISLDVSQSGSEVAIGDLNGDGRLDLRAGSDGGGGGGGGVAGASLTISNAAGAKGLISVSDAGSSVSISGDPDFDLLRLSANQDTAKISMSGQISGDPDFDLLRIVGAPSSSSIALSGDPDFDMLRMSATPSSSELAITGDPDFDMLRMSSNADTALIRISGQVDGDPDFDLLKMMGAPKIGEATMKVKNSIGNVRGITTQVDSTTARTFLWTQTGGPFKSMVEMNSDDSQSSLSISNAAGSKGVVSACTPGHATITATRDGHSRVSIASNDSSSSIAIGEEGVQIAMTADTGTSNPTASLTISNAAGSKGLATGVTPGTTTLRMYRDGSNTVMISSDDTLSSIAIDEEGVQVFMDADTAGQARFGISEPGVSDRVIFDSDGDGYLSSTLKIGTTSGSNHIEVVGGANCDGTTWNNASDVNSKENFQAVNGEEILQKLEELDITRWNYKGKEDVEHIGPTAQDFYKAFGVGNDDISISTVDPSGIALAAIKELYKKSKEVDQLKRELEELANRVEKLAKEKK